jgi:hypothetical protein
MDEVICAVRKKAVKNSPEELVRQKFLHTMVHEWGYPPSLLVVEQSLRELPNIPYVPKNLLRRFDIVAYAKTQASTLAPLLLIECKKKFVEKDFRQLLGYNYYIGAPYVALCDEMQFFCADARQQDEERELIPLQDVPTYSFLLSRL